MGYAIDRRLIRLAGDLLAGGSGTFTATDVRRVFGGALQDDALAQAETAAILAVYVTVFSRANAEAKRLLESVANNSRQDDPYLWPWLLQSLSARLLGQAATLIAGRGARRRVSRKDVLALMSDAYQQGGSSPGLSAQESLAFLVIRELLHGRLAPDAQQTLDKQCAVINQDGLSLGDDGSSGGTGDTPGGGGRQCGACSGTGYQTCGSCGGYGYHTRSGTRTRYDGSTEYYQEQVPCSCSGGRVRCGRCGGTGRL